MVVPMIPLAADDGGSSLPGVPDWVADAPPWVQIVALIVVGLPTLGTLIGSVMLLVQALRRRPDPAPGTGSTAGPAASTTTPTPTSAPAQQADEKLTLIGDLVRDLQRRLVLVEQEAAGLREALDSAEETLAQVRQELWQVTWERDQLRTVRAPRTSPRHPPPATSSGGWPG